MAVEDRIGIETGVVALGDGDLGQSLGGDPVLVLVAHGDLGVAKVRADGTEGDLELGVGGMVTHPLDARASASRTLRRCRDAETGLAHARSNRLGRPPHHPRTRGTPEIHHLGVAGSDPQQLDQSRGNQHRYPAQGVNEQAVDRIEGDSSVFDGIEPNSRHEVEGGFVGRLGWREFADSNDGCVFSKAHHESIERGSWWAVTRSGE